MAKRKGKRAHYEQAFEALLRQSQIPYIAINESKRPVIKGKTIKNFDFIVYSSKGSYLIDIKGKYFPYKYKKSLNYWENWIKTDDIEGLRFWQRISGRGFESIIVYPYLIRYKEDKKHFKNVFNFKNNSYGIVGIELNKYLKNSKPRSVRWNAISVSREKFKNLVKPISFFVSEIKILKND